MKRDDGFEQIVDGEGFELESGVIHNFKCCDCGLVHRVVLISEDEKPIGVAMERVNEINTTKQTIQ